MVQRDSGWVFSQASGRRSVRLGGPVEVAEASRRGSSVPSRECQMMKATTTEGQIQDNVSGQFAPEFAPNIGKSGQSVSFSVISSTASDEPREGRENPKNPKNSSKKASPAVVGGKASEEILLKVVFG